MLQQKYTINKVPIENSIARENNHGKNKSKQKGTWTQSASRTDTSALAQHVEENQHRRTVKYNRNHRAVSRILKQKTLHQARSFE